MREEKIVVGTSGVYAPFTYRGEDGELTGFDVEVIREVAERLGVEIEFVTSDFDGLIGSLNSSRIDVLANQTWRTPQREEDYTLTDFYMLSSPVLVVHKDNTDIRSLDDIAGRVGGHSETSVYANMTREHGGRVEILTTYTEQALNIELGRIDYTINNIGSVVHYFQENPNAPLLAIPLQLDRDFEVVFALPGQNAEKLRDAINEILVEMKADGTLQRIYDKYFNLDDLN